MRGNSLSFALAMHETPSRICGGAMYESMHIDRRKNPRPDSGLRYRRLRREIDPPGVLSAFAEGLAGGIDRIGRRLRALARLVKRRAAARSIPAPSPARRKASSIP